MYIFLYSWVLYGVTDATPVREYELLMARLCTQTSPSHAVASLIISIFALFFALLFIYLARAGRKKRNDDFVTGWIVAEFIAMIICISLSLAPQLHPVCHLAIADLGSGTSASAMAITGITFSILAFVLTNVCACMLSVGK